MRFRIAFIISFIVPFYGYAQKHSGWQLDIPFNQDAVQAPDYASPENWAALPGKVDNADKVPSSSGLKDEQATATADVFFVHPTTYLKTTSTSNQWNADTRDKQINDGTDRGTILYQASTMNGAGRIYAPRYRQAQISVFFAMKKVESKLALDLAYNDVKRAFQYYLDHYNNGRPIIIASHSQGTSHAVRLLVDFFDGKPLQQQLVAAYLIGMPVYDSLYTNIKPCENAEETGCFVSWRTFAWDYYPEWFSSLFIQPVCTNPLTWKTDSIYASRDLNEGGILKDFNKIIPRLNDAQVKDGLLQIHKPHFFGNVFFNFKNYHIVDYNLFYLNIRKNAQLRVKSFTDKMKN